MILQIVNAAAEAYRGVIPADRWHDPYMPAAELSHELAAGVVFTGCEARGQLVGIMGIQAVHNVSLIRHAYVLPSWQGRGVGGRLMSALLSTNDRPVLVGTWAAAEWAVRFYKRHDFATVPHRAIGPLLRCYWTVPDRQIDTSTVLARPPLSEDAVRQLIAASVADEAAIGGAE